MPPCSFASCSCAACFPIVGNLISNTVIVGVGFTISPKMGLLALSY